MKSNLQFDREPQLCVVFETHPSALDVEGLAVPALYIQGLHNHHLHPAALVWHRFYRSLYALFAAGFVDRLGYQGLAHRHLVEIPGVVRSTSMEGTP